jgi:hypothetical protein
MKSIFQFILTISVFSLMMSCIPGNSIDVEACKKKVDPCEQYHCLFPGCWCVPDTAGTLVLFEAGKAITSLEEAQELSKAHLTEAAIEYENLNVIQDDYGWFHMIFDEVRGGKELHYSISPKGEICHTECGV